MEEDERTRPISEYMTDPYQGPQIQYFKQHIDFGIFSRILKPRNDLPDAELLQKLDELLEANHCKEKINRPSPRKTLTRFEKRDCRVVEDIFGGESESVILKRHNIGQKRFKQILFDISQGIVRIGRRSHPYHPKIVRETILSVASSYKPMTLSSARIK